MATPAEHQYEALLALATKITPVVEATRTYLDRLGDDRGKAARISRRSHLGLFEPAVAALADEWGRREPAVYDDAVHAAFGAANLTLIVAALGRHGERAIDAWDDGVRDLAARAASLDSAVRGHLQRVQGEPSVPDYELLGELGRGGFGEVYSARDSAGVARAVKILAPSALAPPRGRGGTLSARSGAAGRSEPSERGPLHQARTDSHGDVPRDGVDPRSAPLELGT